MRKLREFDVSDDLYVSRNSNVKKSNERFPVPNHLFKKLHFYEKKCKGF